MLLTAVLSEKTLTILKQVGLPKGTGCDLALAYEVITSLVVLEVRSTANTRYRSLAGDHYLVRSRTIILWL
jgi:hypothetical protein